MTDRPDRIVQVKRLRTISELRARLAALGVDDAVDPGGDLAEPFAFTDGAGSARAGRSSCGAARRSR